MKNILVILFTVLASVSFAQTKQTAKAAPVKAAPAKQAAPTKRAANFTRHYGMAGCGLGSVVMGKEGGQVSAGTTNGTSFNQTFGISAGTLNCVDSPSAEVAGRLDHFILVNRSQIQGDIARGNGETIMALGSYMGCTDSSKQIGAQLKANYSDIFNEKVQTNEITDSIISVILSSPELSHQCNKLG